MMKRFLKYLWHNLPWTSYWEHKFILKKLIEKNLFTLDLGCGEWATASKFISCKKIGIDLVPKIHFKPQNFHYVRGDVKNLPFKDNVFQQVIASAILEHVDDIQKVASEIKRVLKKDGFLLIICPSKYWRLPFYNFLKNFCLKEEKILENFGHKKKGFCISEIYSIFKDFKIIKVKYFINRICALGYDFQFFKFKLLGNFLLRLFFPLFYLSAIFGNSFYGTHLAVKMKKCV